MILGDFEMTVVTTVRLDSLIPGDTFKTSDGHRILITPDAPGTFKWARLTDGAVSGTTDGAMLVEKIAMKAVPA